MDYVNLLMIAAVVAGAALLWVVLATKMVADDEEAKAYAEAERRQREIAKENARQAASGGRLSAEGRPGASE